MANVNIKLWGYNFNGTDDYYQVNSNGFGTFDQQTYSISMWVTTPATLQDYHILWSYDYTSHVAPYYAQHLRINSDGSIYYGWNFSGSSSALGTPSGTIVPNTRYHIAVCFTSGSQKIYVNANEVASGTGTGTVTYYNQPVWIGKGNWGLTKPMRMDDVRFYPGKFLMVADVNNLASLKSELVTGTVYVGDSQDLDTICEPMGTKNNSDWGAGSSYAYFFSAGVPLDGKFASYPSSSYWYRTPAYPETMSPFPFKVNGSNVAVPSRKGCRPGNTQRASIVNAGTYYIWKKADGSIVYGTTWGTASTELVASSLDARFVVLALQGAGGSGQRGQEGGVGGGGGGFFVAIIRVDTLRYGDYWKVILASGGAGGSGSSASTSYLYYGYTMSYNGSEPTWTQVAYSGGGTYTRTAGAGSVTNGATIVALSIPNGTGGAGGTYNNAGAGISAFTASNWPESYSISLGGTSGGSGRNGGGGGGPVTWGYGGIGAADNAGPGGDGSIGGGGGGGDKASLFTGQSNGGAGGTAQLRIYY